jgi:DNA polymerase IV
MARVNTMKPDSMPTLCRDCHVEWPNGTVSDRCQECGSPRLLRHPELIDLAIAHIDCDAFYATVEKRDNPELAEKPVLVGGRTRGVVMAACYVARLYGCHSAMPMFQALKACPNAVVVKPNMAKYSAVGKEIRALMRETTPLVEPLSIDEAFLDLTGTERLHHGSPARTLARLATRIEQEIGITASVGLSYNKFLAKVGSDLDKPRGFAILGREEAVEFLAKRSVSTIWGVGKALKEKLQSDGITTIGQLRRSDEERLVTRYGVIGRRLYRFSRGLDDRVVTPHSHAKSVSAESTFNEDLRDSRALTKRLWPLCEKVASRLKDDDLAGSRITLKMKTRDFKTLTRNRTLGAPTQLAETLFRTARPLLDKEANGRRFRLIGIGVGELTSAENADPMDFLDPKATHRAAVEHAIDAVRAKLGKNAIVKGRNF